MIVTMTPEAIGLTVLATYVTLSTVAFVMYGIDKSAARNGTWRIPEATLHAVSLVGGWPGALAGQCTFRHKTRKQPFRGIFWVTVAINCAALAMLLITSPVARG